MTPGTPLTKGGPLVGTKAGGLKDLTAPLGPTDKLEL